MPSPDSPRRRISVVRLGFVDQGPTGLSAARFVAEDFELPTERFEFEAHVGDGEGIAFFVLPKKALSNERSSDSMHQSYLFPTSLAIIFVPKPMAGIGPNSPRPFSLKTCH